MIFWSWLPPSLQELFSWLGERPFLLLLLMTLPLAGLALLRRVYPSRLLVLLVAIPAPLSVSVVLAPELSNFIVILDLLILLVALADLTSTVSHRQFETERRALRVASIQKPHDVTLTITNRSRRTLRMQVRDDLPEEFSGEPEEFPVRLGKRSRVTLKYRFYAQVRGKFLMQFVHLRVNSRWGLWRSFLRIPCESAFHVYPDMQQLSQYAVLARTNRLSLLGVRRTRRVGQDNEFERLRDFTKDDNYKHIDWRSTARRNKLTVRDFQTNQSQRIIFMVDCGRMMTNLANGLSLLDHSLNAMLMMSYVALRQGDSVGLICFSNGIHRYVPPRGGLAQMNHLLHAVFDRFPQLVESRYDQAFFHLATHCPKRALVVLMTNVVDEVNALQVEQYLGSLVGRHLPMGVMLRDHELFHAADRPTRTVSQVYEAAAAAEILTWRHQVLRDLEHRGVLSLDVFPDDMTAPLINRYLEVKARHLL